MRLLPLFLCSLFTGQEIICSGNECYPKEFVPSNDWQVLRPGQEIPAGLHVRLNIDTLQKEAKLMDPEENSDTDLVVVESPPEAASHLDRTSREFMEFESSINTIINYKNGDDIHSALDLLLELCHDIDYGIHLITYSDQLIMLTQSDMQEMYSEKIYRIVAASVQNNALAIQNFVSHHLLTIHTLIQQLRSSSALSRFRILGILNRIVINGQIQFKSALLDELVYIYPTDEKCSQRIIKFLEDLKVITENDSETNSDKLMSQFIQVQLINTDKTEDAFQLYYRKLVELHKSNTGLKPEKTFVAWLDEQAGKRQQNSRQRDADNKDEDEDESNFDRFLVRTRHLIFGNPNSLRVHDEL